MWTFHCVVDEDDDSSIIRNTLQRPDIRRNWYTPDLSVPLSTNQQVRIDFNLRTMMIPLFSAQLVGA
jgi:hypothetical protein